MWVGHHDPFYPRSVADSRVARSPGNLTLDYHNFHIIAIRIDVIKIVIIYTFIKFTIIITTITNTFTVGPPFGAIVLFGRRVRRIDVETDGKTETIQEAFGCKPLLLCIVSSGII
jgi:hypothetical protein